MGQGDGIKIAVPALCFTKGNMEVKGTFHDIRRYTTAKAAEKQGKMGKFA
jgi:hypothetical protein